MNNIIKLSTVKLISQLLQPLAETGIFTISEKREIIAQLKSLAETGQN